MTSILRSAFTLSALLAFTVPAAFAQDTDKGNGRGQQAGHRLEPAAKDAAKDAPKDATERRDSDTDENADVTSVLESWKKGRPIAMQYLPRAGSARRQRVRDDQGSGRGVQGRPAGLRRGVHVAGPEHHAPQYRGAEHRQQRQHESAAGHRLRVQQLDGQPVSERAARARRARRAHELSVVAASQRDVGQGRLHPDRRVAARYRAAQGADADHHAARRPLRDQLRRRALPPQRQRQRALQPVRRQLHPRRVHDRDRRGSLSEDQGRGRDGVDHRRRNPRHGGDPGPARADVHRQARCRPAGEEGPARAADRLDVSRRQGDEQHALRRRPRRLALLLGAGEHGGDRIGAGHLGPDQSGLQEQGDWRCR